MQIWPEMRLKEHNWNYQQLATKNTHNTRRDRANTIDPQQTVERKVLRKILTLASRVFVLVSPSLTTYYLDIPFIRTSSSPLLFTLPFLLSPFLLTPSLMAQLQLQQQLNLVLVPSSISCLQSHFVSFRSFYFSSLSPPNAVCVYRVCLIWSRAKLTECLFCLFSSMENITQRSIGYNCYLETCS